MKNLINYQIIRGVRKARFPNTFRSGTDTAQTMHYRSCSFALNCNFAFSFHKQSLFNLNKFFHLRCASDTESHLSNKFQGLPLYQLTHAKFGFTLAEVLITLGIIGVVAAMTLPALIQKHEKYVMINRLKKSYSTVNTLLRDIEAANGHVSEWSEWSIDLPWYRRDIDAVMTKYFLPITKGKLFSENTVEDKFIYKFMCYTPDSSPLNTGNNGKKTQYLKMSKDSFSLKANDHVRSILLKDGSCIGFDSTSTPGDIADVFIDVNGPQKPNVVGKDLFLFKLNVSGKLNPMGWEQDRDTINTQCIKQQNEKEFYCTAKVIMDGWQFKDDYPW